MVKNREELIKVAQSNANQMKGHLRKAVGDFLNAQGVSPEELAYVLGITNNEMHQILDGDGNVSVDVLSKLLVATDMAVEVKPIRNTPLKRYGAGMPRSGGFPGPGGIPVDENGRILPPPPGFDPRFMGAPAQFKPREERVADEKREEIPMETTGPIRDSHGRFVKRSTARKPATNVQRPTVNANPYANIADNELVNIIRQNIWDGEIDVNHATHDELAEFVANKERIMRERSESCNGQPNRVEKRDEAKVNGGGNTLNQFIEMLGNVAKEAEHNPALMDAIQRFMPRK